MYDAFEIDIEVKRKRDGKIFGNFLLKSNHQLAFPFISLLILVRYLLNT